jgi:uncharacterized membrane protein
LTIVTFGLVAISVTALKFFILHENAALLPSFLPKQWTEGTLIIFLIIVVSIIFEFSPNYPSRMVFFNPKIERGQFKEKTVPFAIWHNSEG